MKKMIKTTVNTLMTTAVLIAPFSNQAVAADREVNINVETNMNGQIEKRVCKSKTIQQAINLRWQSEFTQSGFMVNEGNTGWAMNRNGTEGQIQGDRGLLVKTVDPVQKIGELIEGFMPLLEAARKEHMELLQLEITTKLDIYERLVRDMTKQAETTAEKLKELRQEYFVEARKLRDEYFDRINSGQASDQALATLNYAGIHENYRQLFSEQMNLFQTILGPSIITGAAEAAGLSDLENLKKGAYKYFLEQMLSAPVMKELTSGTTGAKDYIQGQINFVREHCASAAVNLDFHADLSYHFDESGDVYAIEGLAGQADINALSSAISEISETVGSVKDVNIDDVESPWVDMDNPFPDSPWSNSDCFFQDSCS